MRSNKKQSTSGKKKLAMVLVALGMVVIAFSQLFEVKLLPSEKVKKARRVLGLAVEDGAESEELSYDELVDQVIPKEGKTVLVEWGDMGRKLIEVGAIDLEKFEKRYNGFNDEQREILQGDDLDQITFTSENIQFWTNVLWALGLTQKSQVLSSGPMMQNEKRTPIENYASTAGWTLGSKQAMQLYNGTELVKLTVDQDDLVYKVAENIFRPCCGNSTAYPDCNHGMAVLGLLELLASQGASEAEMYQAALAFNAYAFASTYINAAAYYHRQGIAWADVNPKQVLAPTFSSAQGAGFVARAVGEIPGAPKQGSSCGA